MSSHGSGKLNTGKSSSARRTTMSNSSKTGKEELHKKSANGERWGPTEGQPDLAHCDKADSINGDKY